MKKSRFGWIVSLGLAAMLAAAPGLASAAAQKHSAPDSRLVQIVLLVGTLDGTSETGSIPENAVQALKDIESFLPYKSYRLLDTALIRSNMHARSVLNGLEGREYALSFDFRTEKGDSVDRLVFRQFRMEQSPVPPAGRRHRPDAMPDVAPSAPDPPPAPSAPIAPRAPRDVISTSFTVDVGETIVVGTSKLNGGDTALLVLLTVIP